MEPGQRGRSPEDPPKANLPLGRLMITMRAQAVLTPEDLMAALQSHGMRCWGKGAAIDQAGNVSSIPKGLRILSSHRTAKDETFWIITEAGRESTTVLLPSDY